MPDGGVFDAVRVSYGFVVTGRRSLSRILWFCNYVVLLVCLRRFVRFAYDGNLMFSWLSACFLLYLLPSLAFGFLSARLTLLSLVSFYDLYIWIVVAKIAKLLFHCCKSFRFQLSPDKQICVFEHSVMTNFNCACPAIQRGLDLAFCLKVPLDSLLVWASSGGSGETARMCRLAWTFAARIGDKYQIRLTRSNWEFPVPQIQAGCHTSCRV